MGARGCQGCIGVLCAACERVCTSFRVGKLEHARVVCVCGGGGGKRKEWSESKEGLRSSKRVVGAGWLQPYPGSHWHTPNVTTDFTAVRSLLLLRAVALEVPQIVPRKLHAARQWVLQLSRMGTSGRDAARVSGQPCLDCVGMGGRGVAWRRRAWLGPQHSLCSRPVVLALAHKGRRAVVVSAAAHHCAVHACVDVAGLGRGGGGGGGDTGE